MVSVICGRRVSDSRVFLNGWLGERNHHLIVAPDQSFEAGWNAYRFHVGEDYIDNRSNAQDPTLGLPTLLYVGELSATLPAAVAVANAAPRIPVSIATTIDGVLDKLLAPETPSPLVSAALQGLVAIESVEDRILTTVVNARELAPLLRSPYEGLVYYMLESRGETRGKFMTNQRVAKPEGSGSYEVDLLCAEASLVVEIDGDQHDTPQQKARDETKNRDLEALGYRVRRFSTGEVAKEPVGVWQLIKEQLGLMAAERGK